MKQDSMIEAKAIILAKRLRPRSNAEALTD